MNDQIKISLITLFHYPIILAFLTYSRAITLPLEENLPACYMRNSQGQLINLGKLCASESSTTFPVNPCTNSQAKSVTAEQIVFSQVNYRSFHNSFMIFSRNFRYKDNQCYGQNTINVIIPKSIPNS